MARKWASVILILIALNAFSLNLGYGSPIFCRLYGFLSLVGAFFLYGKYSNKIHDIKLFAIGLVLVLISLAVLFSTLRQEFWLASLPIFICGCDLVLRSLNRAEDHFIPLALGSLIYAIFYIGYIHIPSLWLGIRFLSQIITESLGRIVGISLNIGPTMSGLLILLTFFSITISFFILSEKEISGSLKLFFASLAGLTVVYAGHVMVLAGSGMAVNMVMDDIYFIFLILLIPFMLSVPRFKIKSIDIDIAVPKPRNVSVLICIFFIITLITIFPYSDGSSVGKIVFYEKETEMGFDIPQFPKSNESFEPDMGFSVGALKLYLENIGYRVEDYNDTYPHTLKDALTDANILVMMNLNKPFSPSDLQSIWDFVKLGGGLLIFGDHTSMFVSDQDFILKRDYLNDALEPTGIRINSDTADYVNGHWKYGNIFLPHYITRGLGFDISTSSVGASLNLSGNARPVIIGKYAFSDNPDLSTPGHLGNRQYEYGEALGDLVVAASDTYGNGNVLVFGDTSYVFNADLPFRYKLFIDSVAWLRSDEFDLAHSMKWLSILILFILISYIVLIHRLKITSIFLASIALIVAFSLAVSGNINDSLIPSSSIVEKDIAWIDHSHLNRYNLENYQADGIAGLTTNLLRNGYLPMIMENKNDFPEISKGKVFIIIAPNEPYSSKETSLLRDFVRSGGLLIISAGHECSAPLDSILDSFNLKIGDLPLGSPPWIVETHGTMGQGTVSSENLRKYWHKPKFMEAYPVLTLGNDKPIAWINYGGNNYSLISDVRFNQGNVILIGDSRFLLNENLEYLSLGSGKETKQQYQLQWLGNIELLREILAKHKGEKT